MPHFDVDDYPQFYLTLTQLPEAKNWEVGGRYKLEVEVEQLSMDKKSAGFKIVTVKPKEEKDPSEMDSEEHKAFMARQKRKDYPRE